MALAGIAAYFVWFLLPFNQLTPLWADDYSRILHLRDSGFSAFHLALGQYVEMGGRLTVYLGLYLLFHNHDVLLPIFDVVNAGAYAALSLAMFWCARGRLPNSLTDAFTTVASGLLLWLGATCIAESALWKTGSLAYLWVVTLNLVVLGSFLRIHNERNPCPERAALSPVFLIVLAAVAFLAASGLESVSFPVATLIAGFAVSALLKRTPPMSRAHKALASGYALGCALLFLSPGNFGRLDVIGVPQQGRLPYLVPFADQSLLNLATGKVWLVLLFAVAMAALTPSQANRRWPIFVLLAFGVGAFHMVAVPWIPLQNRTLFPVEVFLLTAALAITGAWEKQTSIFVRAIYFAVFAFAIVTGFSDRHVVLGDMQYLNDVLIDREKGIEYSFQVKGETDVTTYPLRIASKDLWVVSGDYRTGRYFILDITPNANHWVNLIVAARYPISSIKTRPVN